MSPSEVLHAISELNEIFFQLTCEITGAGIEVRGLSSPCPYTSTVTVTYDDQLQIAANCLARAAVTLRGAHDAIKALQHAERLITTPLSMLNACSTEPADQAGLAYWAARAREASSNGER